MPQIINNFSSKVKAKKQKKKQRSPIHFVYLAALSGIIVYSYNTILEPLVFGNIEADGEAVDGSYSSIAASNIIERELRRSLTSRGHRQEQIDRILAISQETFPECMGCIETANGGKRCAKDKGKSLSHPTYQHMTAYECDEFIKDFIFNHFTEEDRYIRTVLKGERGANDAWYNSAVLLVNDKDIVTGVSNDGMVYYEFDWNGSGEKATPEQESAIPPIHSIETDEGYAQAVAALPDETSYSPVPASVDASIQSGSPPTNLPATPGPTPNPTPLPTNPPVIDPTPKPTPLPTPFPITSQPTNNPTPLPTNPPVPDPTPKPTLQPITPSPTDQPITSQPTEPVVTTTTTTVTTTTTTIVTTTTVAEEEQPATTVASAAESGGASSNVESGVPGSPLTSSPTSPANPPPTQPAAVTPQPTQQPTPNPTDPPVTSATSPPAPATFQAVTYTEASLTAFEEPLVVEGAVLDDVLVGNDDSPIVGGTLQSPDAVNEPEGEERFQAAMSEPEVIEPAGARTIGPWNCQHMTGVHCCMMIKKDVRDADMNGNAIQCHVGYKEGTGKKAYENQITGKKIQIHADRNMMTKKEPKITGSWGNLAANGKLEEYYNGTAAKENMIATGNYTGA